MNRPPSTIEIDGDIARISLRNQKGLVVDYAIIDSEDVSIVSGMRWYKTSHGYCASKTKTIVYLHRMIVDGCKIDHANLNKLDNRKENLRPCSQSQNLANSTARKTSKTGVKGVHRFKGGPKFAAQITKNRKVYCLGVFETVDQAAAAYSSKAKELYGEFARCTYPK